NHDITFLSYGSDPSAVAAMRSEKVNVQTVARLKVPNRVTLYLALLRNLFSPLPYSVTKHYSVAFQKRLQKLLDEGAYDIVHCEWTPYANFLRSGTRQPVILSTHNIEAKIWERRARHSSSRIARVFFRAQERKMEAFERLAFTRFRNV